MWFPILVTVLAGYLLGNLNGAFNSALLIFGEDIRKKGSGNAGLTNFIRCYGAKKAWLVVLVDMTKTILSCLAGSLLLAPYGYELHGAMIGAAAVSLGHDFPALLGFRGGKGVLSGLSIALAVDYRIALIILAVFAAFTIPSGYVSLGSIMGSIAFGVCFVIFYHNTPFVMIFGILLGLLVVFMHHTNIKRLFKGTENKISFKKKAG